MKMPAFMQPKSKRTRASRGPSKPAKAPPLKKTRMGSSLRATTQSSSEERTVSDKSSVSNGSAKEGIATSAVRKAGFGQICFLFFYIT